MPIVVLVLALVGYGYALLVLPQARRTLVAGGLVVALALGKGLACLDVHDARSAAATFTDSMIFT